MLTSPVNVATALNGAPLKPHSPPSDSGARKEPAPLAAQPPVAETVIEPELPSNSPMTSVNAVAATAGNRTILQELSLNVAMALRITRRQDESLTSVFLRIIAAIETMGRGERLQFESRSGLKGLKITLADLAAALRQPDGPEAARLTAMAEAPLAVPGRAAASAATTTYLQEGTADGHAEETLAMRAAARSSAAGQSVFAAESKVRPAEGQPDAKVLQDQLKTLFEAGESVEIAAGERTVIADLAEAVAEDADAAPAETMPEDIHTGHGPAMNGGADPVTISTSNLRLDAQALARIRTAAQAIADGSPELALGDKEEPSAEKAEPTASRLPTMLTLKGLVEVVTALPAKAVEMLATAQAAAELTTPEPPADHARPVETAVQMPQGEDALPELAADTQEARTADPGNIEAGTETLEGTAADDVLPSPTRPEAQSLAEKGHRPADPEWTPAARPDLAQHAVPFPYVQLQPARDAMADPVAEEEETRDDGQEDAADDRDDDQEKRRPRDEYDAIHDPIPEDEPTIVINRDSSESDRAFALYQRMGGF